MQSNSDRGPGVKVPPPVIFLFFALCGYFLESVFSLPFVSDAAFQLEVAGLVIAVIAICILAVSVMTFLRHKTGLEPWKPASTLLTKGVFSYSRNPIYVGFCLFVSSMALYFNTVWLVLSLFPAVWLLIRWVIIKEERYLEQRFGEHYLCYKERVRRWL